MYVNSIWILGAGEQNEYRIAARYVYSHNTRTFLLQFPNAQC
jgi:hypothetical protein